MKLWGYLVAATLCLSAGAAAQAQSDYPTKPIKMVVPFAAGSGFDTIARFTAQKLSEVLGQRCLSKIRAGPAG